MYNKNIKMILPQEVPFSLNKELTLIDVREKEEFAFIWTEKTFLFPLSNIQKDPSNLFEFLANKDNVYILCRIGQRAIIAAKLIATKMHTLKIFVIRQGLMGWIDQGLPYRIKK